MIQKLSRSCVTARGRLAGDRSSMRKAARPSAMRGVSLQAEHLLQAGAQDRIAVRFIVDRDIGA